MRTVIVGMILTDDGISALYGGKIFEQRMRVSKALAKTEKRTWKERKKGLAGGKKERRKEKAKHTERVPPIP